MDSVVLNQCETCRIGMNPVVVIQCEKNRIGVNQVVVNQCDNKNMSPVHGCLIRTVIFNVQWTVKMGKNL